MEKARRMEWKSSLSKKEQQPSLGNPSTSNFTAQVFVCLHQSRESFLFFSPSLILNFTQRLFLVNNCLRVFHAKKRRVKTVRGGCVGTTRMVGEV